jgi:phosphatidylglycerophosphatase A
MNFAIMFLATGAFVGRIPFAPGTFGTMVAIPLFFWTANAQQGSVLLTVATLAILTWAACWVAGRAEELLHEHDSHAIVIDEVVGYLAATLFLAPTWEHALAAFFIFRILDIVKPFPASYVDEHVPGGYGVVLDDVVSGVYANIATRLLFLLF